MKTTTLIKTLGSALLLLGLTTASIPSAQGQVVKRDFQDWLAAQTTQFGLINNPDINGDGVADGPAYRILFDYAHLVAPAIGTVSGTVTVRPTVDGREDVTVNIEFEDVLLRVYLRTIPSPGTLVFGSLPADIANGATPALVSGITPSTFFKTRVLRLRTIATSCCVVTGTLPRSLSTERGSLPRPSIRTLQPARLASCAGANPSGPLRQTKTPTAAPTASSRTMSFICSPSGLVERFAHRPFERLSAFETISRPAASGRESLFPASAATAPKRRHPLA